MKNDYWDILNDLGDDAPDEIIVSYEEFYDFYNVGIPSATSFKFYITTPYKQILIDYRFKVRTGECLDKLKKMKRDIQSRGRRFY